MSTDDDFKLPTKLELDRIISALPGSRASFQPVAELLEAKPP